MQFDEQQLKNLLKFRIWQINQIKKLNCQGVGYPPGILEEKTKIQNCSCITSLLSPSWASSVHDISFHVCKTHAKEFNIPDGPYWHNEVKVIKQILKSLGIPSVDVQDS